MFRFLKRAGAITSITIEPPQADEGRDGIAIVVIAKNDAANIGEWARFHLAAGVRHFYVYDNGSTDGTVDAIVDVAGRERVTAFPWDLKLWAGRKSARIHIQVLAYAHAVSNFGGQYRWMAFIDLDEFLVPKSAGTLPECLAHLDGEASISLPWHMFGRNGFKVPPEGGIVANYTMRHPDPMSPHKGLCNFKMIADPCRITALKVHSNETDGSNVSVNDVGKAAAVKERKRSDFYSAEHIQLNHYYTRSDSELQTKLNLGGEMTGNGPDHRRRVMRKVEQVEAESVEDLVAKDWFAARS